MNRNNQVLSSIEGASPNTSSIEMPLLAKSWLRLARVAWVFLALLGMGIFITSLPGYALKFQGALPAHGLSETTQLHKIVEAVGGAASLVAAMVSIGLATFLYRRRFENPAALAISFYMLIYGVVMSGVIEAWGLYWLGTSDYIVLLQGVLLGTPTIALFALFPNGRFVPSWMRWIVLASVPLTIFFFIISPETFMRSDLVTTIIVAIIWIFLLPVSCTYAQIYRFRKVSTEDERHQTKWVMYGLALWIGFIVVSSIPYIYLTNLPSDAPSPWWVPISSLGWWVSVNILPLSFTIAVTRSKLWNIDIVINRTLVYGGLTILTLGFYILVVGYLGNLIQTVDQSLIAFIATGIIAVLFQPLRARIQGTVNRMMYGNRDDPVAVLSELGEKLEQTGSPEDALSSIVEIIPRTLKLPFAAIELGEQVTSFGVQNSEVIKLPLTYQSDVIGHLAVGLRSPGESFSSADIKLLENIAHRAGAAAHAAKLTADLRQSRLKLVTLREEERRRIRRDLHDGLGPTLASQTLRLDAIRNLLRESPEKAETLIDDLKDQTLETIQDIRNLVYDLRPPALDEMGLIGAIHNFIEAKPSDNLEVKLVTPDKLPPLSAALEVAIYRTILEGITNVLHHANAESVEIKIEVKDPHLVVEIKDDGVGLPEDVSLGVGLVSMQERADELGGKFKLRSSHHGVLIQVSFPLPSE